MVAKRPSSLQIHRRKAVNERPTPKSGHSSLSAADPQATFGSSHIDRPVSFSMPAVS